MSIPIAGAALKTAFAGLGAMGSTLQAALAIGTTAVSYIGAQQQARALEQANAEANERARQYLIEDYDQMTVAGQQAKAAATQRIQEAEIKGARTRAQVAVAAGEGGVGGLSVDSLLKDLYGQEAAIRDGVNQNLESTAHQMNVERRGMQRATVDQMASRPIPEYPSLAGTLLEAGTGIYGAYKDDLRVRAQV